MQLINYKVESKFKWTEHKSITKRKKKKHDRIVLLAKAKLNTIKNLITTALIDMYINHD